jgi:hypothetical protein
MTERRTRRGRTERVRVNLSLPLEVMAWCEKLGCAEAELILAVYEAGTDAENVRAFLYRRMVGGNAARTLPVGQPAT